MSQDRDIFKPSGGSIYRKFNEMRFRSKEKLYQALLKMIPTYPNIITRSILMYYLERNRANMKLVKSAYHGLEVYCLISRVAYRWQFDNNDEYVCKNPAYPDKTNKVIKVNDMCPRMKRRVRAGHVRPPSGYENRKHQPNW